jgi:hypothetical protein
MVFLGIRSWIPDQASTFQTADRRLNTFDPSTRSKVESAAVPAFAAWSTAGSRIAPPLSLAVQHYRKPPLGYHRKPPVSHLARHPLLGAKELADYRCLRTCRRFAWWPKEPRGPDHLQGNHVDAYRRARSHAGQLRRNHPAGGRPQIGEPHRGRNRNRAQPPSAWRRCSRKRTWAELHSQQVYQRPTVAAPSPKHQDRLLPRPRQLPRAPLALACDRPTLQLRVVERQQRHLGVGAFWRAGGFQFQSAQVVHAREPGRELPSRPSV